MKKSEAHRHMQKVVSGRNKQRQQRSNYLAAIKNKQPDKEKQV